MASNNLRIVTGAVALLLAVPGQSQNSDVLSEDIERCRAITDVLQRLACYDNIGTPGTAPTQTLEAPGDSEYGELTDDVGLPKSADDYKPIRVTVVQCGESKNRKYYFYFKNGQAWQYLGARAPRYRSCNKPATLTEDSMGFSLQMDEDKLKHRVKRVR